MPYRNMTLDELARHIGMDAREVRRLADRGRLPGNLVGGHWRFNSAQLLDWFQREIHTLPDRDLRNLERAMSDNESEDFVSALVPTECVDINLPARSKASVLRELVNLAERSGMIYDPAALVKALEEREAIYSTALPNGIALPHPRRPLEHAYAEPLVCLAAVPAGVPFGAPDGRLTDVFVLVCSHEERHHLRVLARLAMMFTTDLPDRIRAAESNEAALEALLETEARVLAKKNA
jgi:nitrogen PTS system EIIA component